ncbi:ImpB/MucB/SamB family protein, partial [Lacticaseibacillus rhamnosus MTCC 5462]
ANNRDSDIVTTLREIFRDNWHGEVVRNVAVYTSRLAPDTGEQLNFLNRSISKSRQQIWNERLMRSAIDSALKHSSTPKAPCTAVPPFSAHHL